MKILYTLSLFILLFSCKQESDNGIKIDLTQKKAKIRYSEFVDSVSYLTFIFERLVHHFPNPAIIYGQ